MVKKGPCLHCGINSTPLWRNGPAEKPVLCNACGSRYRLKGHLDNYLPKNAQLQLCLNNSESANDRSNLNVDNKFSDHDLQTGGTNPDLWKSKIPSKKRSVVVYKQMTPMERFQKQLLSLFSCQSQPDKSSPEEVLLMDNVNNFIPRNEIGLGGILLKPADYTTPADEGSSTCASNNQ